MSNFCRSDINCSIDASNPAPNSDIAGTGVVIGFVGTAYLVLFLLFVHYLVAFDPNLPPPLRESIRPEQVSLQHEDQNEESSRQMRSIPDYWKPNTVDVQLLTFVRQATKKILRQCPGSPTDFWTRHSAHFQPSFDRAISTMCDIQIITGISVLTGGFICLDENLSSHHWQLIVYLAWFSSITHLSALTSLRRYLQVHSREKHVRLTFMFLLLVMLVTAMIPTMFFNWRSSVEERIRNRTAASDATSAYPKMPAVCFFSIKCGKALYYEGTYRYSKIVPFTSSIAFQETIISLTILIISFSFRAIKFSTRISSVLHRILTRPISKDLHDLSKRLDSNPIPGANSSSFIEPHSSLHVWTTVIRRPASAVVIAIQKQTILLNSMFLEQYWLLVILLWGTSKLKRSLAEEWHYEKLSGRKPSFLWYVEMPVEGENVMATYNTRWEFGQILPILLLAAPLSTMLGNFASTTNFSPNQLLGAAESTIRRHSIDVADSHRRSRSSESIEMARFETQDRPQQLTQPYTHNSYRTGRRELSTILTVPHSDAKGKWMLPYLASSCVVLCGHTFGLFGYATETFLRETELGLVGLWTPIDYLFRVKRVFFLAILGYIFAGHAIILFGLAMDEWQGQLNTAIYWAFAVAVHTMHLLITYLPTDWVFVKRLWIILSAGFGLLLVFALSFVLVQLSKRFSSTASREGNAVEDGLRVS